jgi:hypothetical protein
VGGGDAQDGSPLRLDPVNEACWDWDGAQLAGGRRLATGDWRLRIFATTAHNHGGGWRAQDAARLRAG